MISSRATIEVTMPMPMPQQPLVVTPSCDHEEEEESTICASSTGKRQRQCQHQRRSISFDERVRVRQIAAVSDLTRHPEKLWFQPHEFQAIKKRVRRVVADIQSGNKNDDYESHCTRGLERLMNMRESQAKKFMAMDSLLDAQDMQRDFGEVDDETLALISRRATAESRKEAEARALEDAAASQQYLEDTRRQCRRWTM
eukprot:Nitzschia sp. Nitz4//scaffold85_size83877//83224//83820//NITZ4_005245-RA/size83877-processed-gene-0.146-mRNA-1//-1//CDS//3329559185//5056//frame0